MNKAKKMIQAYRNTPWRRDLRVIGTFSVLAVAVTVVAIAYVWVTSMAGMYGRQTQIMQATRWAAEQNIEDLKAQLGETTNVGNRKKQAKAENYVNRRPNVVIYLPVEGYPGRMPLQLAPDSREKDDPLANQPPPEYTMSLIEWIQEALFQLSMESGADKIDGGR